MCFLLCQIELLVLPVCKQRAALPVTASDITAATVQACQILQRAKREFGVGLSGLGLFVELWFGFFSSSVSQQQAVVFLCQILCQSRNMRAVSGDPRRVSVSGKGQSLSVKCLHSGAVAASEMWHTADRAASSALQGLRVGSTEERIYLLHYSSFPLTL